MHLDVENNWLIVILCLRGCNTPKPSKAAIVSHRTGISSLDFPRFQNTDQCKHCELWDLPVAMAVALDGIGPDSDVRVAIWAVS